SGRIGPRQAVSTVQAMLNGARFHAVSGQVKAAAVVFESEDAGAEHGTKLSIWILKESESAWQPVPGAEESLPAGIFVVNMDDVNASFSGDWQKYRENVAHDLETASRQRFSALFGPTGVMLKDAAGLPSGTLGQPITLGLVVFRVTGDDQDEVGDFVFYPLNVNAGTRLVFE
ncbi:MAG: hypothetical protein WBD05_09160, partial [Phycisphaerae bacterium]